MAWFYCLVEGENFLLDGDDGPRLMGFYASRYASAKTAEEAELIMLADLKTEYENLRPSDKRTEKPAKVFFKDIEELSEEPKHISNKGAVWYPMDDKD